jgi:hypothetical protein
LTQQRQPPQERALRVRPAPKVRANPSTTADRNVSFSPGKSVIMAATVPPCLKKLAPFMQRASELERGGESGFAYHRNDLSVHLALTTT